MFCGREKDWLQEVGETMCVPLKLCSIQKRCFQSVLRHRGGVEYRAGVMKGVFCVLSHLYVGVLYGACHP